MPKTTDLKDYMPPAYQVKTLSLCFDLHADTTRVTAHSQITRLRKGEPLILNGEQLNLIRIAVDGQPLDSDAYNVSASTLSLAPPGDTFELEVVTEIHPETNTALEGLYLSNQILCTQCEAEGFRKITYFPDRPDVLTLFTVKLIADLELYPVLLANGNCLEQGTLDNQRHYTIWHDPYPKPCYLFALVAGQLTAIEDTFVTQSGREVALKIYVEAHNQNKCAHAMQSLKKAMHWDQQRFGLEYDLDAYNIVAVDSFNMGAMENKGLNIFNSKYVLAAPETATDTDYQNIESVIGHEYFHNWTGNRVTCRDWFQLSLKEGLTVFRDQEFSADMSTRSIKRIDDVRRLRTYQFAEDAGPMAHPIRPQSYIEIDNFYTPTIYEKGAEVIRMLHTLLGEDGFKQGLKLYLHKYDGQAATCDQFIDAMSTANEVDLSVFKRWYQQVGTPVVAVQDHYDPDTGTYRLQLTQKAPTRPSHATTQTLQIPFAFGLLAPDGHDQPLYIDNEKQAANSSTLVIDLKTEQHTLTFHNVNAQPTPSLLRRFSAPIKLEYNYRREQLAFLARHDRDPFNRWEANQTLSIQIIHALLEQLKQGQALSLPEDYIDVIEDNLNDRHTDKALLAASLTLPSQSYLGETLDQIDPDAIHQVHRYTMQQLGSRLNKLFCEIYHENNAQMAYKIDARSIAERRLKNVCLSYLAHTDNTLGFELCLTQFHDSDNMTDSLAALTLLCEYPGQARSDVLAQFYQRWQHDSQVLDKWFNIQAISSVVGTLDQVKTLMQHKKFSLHTPNKVHALIGGFCFNNPLHFHCKDGSGYQFLADAVQHIDGFNPQLAARLASGFNPWRRYDAARQEKIQCAFDHILAQQNLSNHVYEVISKARAAI